MEETKIIFLFFNAHHKLTPHGRDYVFLRRLIKNNSSLSFPSSLQIDCFAFPQ